MGGGIGIAVGRERNADFGISAGNQEIQLSGRHGYGRFGEAIFDIEVEPLRGRIEIQLSANRAKRRDRGMWIARAVGMDSPAVIVSISDVPRQALVVGDEQDGFSTHQDGEEEGKSVFEARPRVLKQPRRADAQGGQAHADVGDVDAGGNVGIGGDRVNVGEEHPPTDKSHHRDDPGGRSQSWRGGVLMHITPANSPQSHGPDGRQNDGKSFVQLNLAVAKLARIEKAIEIQIGKEEERDSANQ